MQYLLAVNVARFFSLLPLPVLHFFSNITAWILQYVVGYRQNVIRDNLRKAFPEKDRNSLRQIEKKFYRNFTDIVVESVKSLTISEGELRQRLRLRNPEVFEQLYAQGKGVIMVMGHYTNFEWMAMGIPLLVPQPCFAVYQRLKDHRYSNLVVNIREQFGLKLFQMKDTYPFMINNTAEAPLYVFMADQSPHKGKVKFRTSFMGRETPVHLGVENLAKKCDLAVVFIEMERAKRGHYEVEAQLLYHDLKGAETHQVTREHVKALEKVIYKKPEDWLWSHKRWKHA